MIDPRVNRGYKSPDERRHETDHREPDTHPDDIVPFDMSYNRVEDVRGPSQHLQVCPYVGGVARHSKRLCIQGKLVSRK